MITFNRTVKYYQVSSFQLFIMAFLTGVIGAALVVINMSVKEYLQLPIVVYENDKCVSVVSYQNGEAFTCEDVDIILRKYRKQNHNDKPENTDIPVHDLPQSEEVGS